MSSFALDHISPTTTATTLASFAQHQDELEGLTGSSGVDVGVGPLESVEGEMDMSITNSTASNVLPSSSPFNIGSEGGLAATAAAAAAAVAAAAHDQEQFEGTFTTSSSDSRGIGTATKPTAALNVTAEEGAREGVIMGGPNLADSLEAEGASGEYKLGLPAQRHISSSDPLARTSINSSSGVGGSPRSPATAPAPAPAPAAAARYPGTEPGHRSRTVTFSQPGGAPTAAAAAAAAAGRAQAGSSMGRDVQGSGDQRKAKGQSLFGKLRRQWSNRGRQDNM